MIASRSCTACFSSLSVLSITWIHKNMQVQSRIYQWAPNVIHKNSENQAYHCITAEYYSACSMCAHPLWCIHKYNNSITKSESSGDFIREIYMTWNQGLTSACSENETGVVSGTAMQEYWDFTAKLYLGYCVKQWLQKTIHIRPHLGCRKYSEGRTFLWCLVTRGTVGCSWYWALSADTQLRKHSWNLSGRCKFPIGAS